MKALNALTLTGLAAGVIAFAPAVVSPETAFMGQDSVASAQSRQALTQGITVQRNGSDLTITAPGNIFWFGQVQGARETAPGTFRNFLNSASTVRVGSIVSNGVWADWTASSAIPSGAAGVLYPTANGQGVKWASWVTDVQRQNTLGALQETLDDWGSVGGVIFTPAVGPSITSYGTVEVRGGMVYYTPAPNGESNQLVSHVPGCGNQRGGLDGAHESGQLSGDTTQVLLINNATCSMPMTWNGSAFTAPLPQDGRFGIVHVSQDGRWRWVPSTSGVQTINVQGVEAQDDWWGDSTGEGNWFQGYGVQSPYLW